MAKMNFDIPHQLSQQEALERIKKLLSEAKKNYGNQIENLQETWEGNTGQFSFSAKGFDLSGSLTVQPNTIELRGDVPFAVSLFKGKIERMIQETAGKLLK
jgi:hypothetical protein